MTTRVDQDGGPHLHLVAAIPQPHNNAYDSALTRPFAIAFEQLAAPLAEHVYGPLAEQHHTLGVIGVNATLTLPRLPLERYFGRMYESALHEHNPVRAYGAILGKVITKASDGIDGPVARMTGTTSEAGAALDPSVDMLGTLDDAIIIKRQARKQGDYVTVGLMNTRVAIDACVIGVGGIANWATARYAKRHGIELDEREQPKALSMGKLKFGLGAVSDAMLLTSYVSPERTTSRNLKRAGQALSAASVVAGAASIVQYGKATATKVRRIRAARQNAS